VPENDSSVAGDLYLVHRLKPAAPPAAARYPSASHTIPSADEPRRSPHRGASFSAGDRSFGLTASPLPLAVARCYEGPLDQIGNKHRHPLYRVYFIGRPHRVCQHKSLARPVLWAILFLDTPPKRSIGFMLVITQIFSLCGQQAFKCLVRSILRRPQLRTE